MADTKLMLQLSRAEALVLFEFLARCEEAERFSFDDEAEQSVVWLIQAQLERQLTEPLQPDYKDLLREARNAVRKDADGG